MSNQPRADAQARADLLIPVVKAWSSDSGLTVASTALQVFGGMGFVEETGIAQQMRDVRIAAIYEGTNGIQALDLVGRKLVRDGGRAFAALVAQIRGFDAQLVAAGDGWTDTAKRLGAAVSAAEAAAQFILDNAAQDAALAGSVAVPFLELVGIVTGGWLMAQAGVIAERHLAAGADGSDYLAAKIVTAKYFAQSQLVKSGALLAQILAGSTNLTDLTADQF